VKTYISFNCEKCKQDFSIKNLSLSRLLLKDPPHYLSINQPYEEIIERPSGI